MRLYAQVSSVSLKQIMKYDVDTGNPDPMYMLQVSVTDLENAQSIYSCTLNEGFGLEDLKAAKKARAPLGEREAIAAQVEAQARTLQGQYVELFISRAKANKNFLTLNVSSVQPLAPDFVQSLLGNVPVEVGA
jgi:hypothetical protein